MKPSILIFMAAALLGWSSLWAQSGYSAGRIQEYLTSGDASSAVRCALGWTKAKPNDDNAWESLGIAYAVGLHRPEKAIPAFKYALAINPYSAQNYNALGEAYMTMKNYPAAAEALEHASELAPLESVYWNNLAAAYTGLDRREQALSAAVTAYNRALESNPRGATVWTSLGSAEQALGRGESAAEHYELGMALGDKLGGRKYAALQNALQYAGAQRAGAALEFTRSATAMTTKQPD